ncbi:MAG: hypothetical protein DHS20C01_33560 [marine bacterium B5-7]|nr:MAG: hypothetical protein DHS20C01_33560 [marine bacterium B5-7]
MNVGQRRLAAILAIDVVAYSRLMGRDEAGTLADLKAHRAGLVDPTIDRFAGRIVKTTGDGMLVGFPSVVDAVECAVDIQNGMVERNRDVSNDDQIILRMGVNVGDVIIDSDDIFGDGVNVAARLESISRPGGVCISDRVHEDVRNRIQSGFFDIGEQSLKNISKPVHAWQWIPEGQLSTTTIESTDQWQPPVVVILPFENMSTNPEFRFLAEGFTEDLATGLSKLDTLRTVSRAANASYGDRKLNAIEAGRGFNAGFVIEGSVRTAGNRIRINANLMDVNSGRSLWAEKFDGTVEDTFDLQDHISQEIVTALEV